MSYPGYPPDPSMPGTYPPSGTSPYPPQPGMPTPGYPPAGGPGYPTQSGFTPGQPGFPPSQPGYPTGQPGYPTAQPGYPPAQPGYPSAQPGYPTAQPGYPAAQPGYPPAQPGYPPAQPGSGYPPAQPGSGYPPAQPGSGYPPAQPGYPPSQPSYPSGQAGYPPAQGGYPSSTAPPAYHTVQTSYPSASHGMSPAAGHPIMTPTLRPCEPFNPRGDAELLRTAMKGFGTDEGAIINILTKRTTSQRQQIVREYKTLYGKELEKHLKSELTGNFEDLMVGLTMPLYEFYAKEIHHALSFSGFRPESVAEIICSATNDEIRQIKSGYEKLYSKSMEKKIKDDLSGDFKRLLISICQASRSENYSVDAGAAHQDAQSLYSAGELRWGTDESVFNMILTTRSFPHLAQVFIEYQKITGRDFDSAVRNEFSGDIKDGLLAIVKCVRNRNDFFAEQLWESMEGAGTSDRTLIRIIVTRCEKDLGDIKRAFQAKYMKTLENVIECDTSGDYRRALLSLASS